MRPRPLFQSLPVFTCFDRGLRFFVSKLCPNSLGTRLKLPPRSSSYIYSIAGGAYPATLGAGSSSLSMSSSVPIRSPLTARMRGSASISSSVHHVHSCPVDAEFDSATQAVEWLRDHGHARAALAGISAVCNSQKRTAYGYSWRFADR